jgi:hypothetical protein
MATTHKELPTIFMSNAIISADIVIYVLALIIYVVNLFGK